MADFPTDTRQRWLTPGVGGIGAASLLADVGHEIPTALLPNLLTATLGAPAAALGLIEGLSDGLAGAARLAGGAIADDPRRRRAQAVSGYATTAVLSSLIGAATTVWQVGVLRAGAWAARGLRVPARNALLADIVPPSVYGRAYGFERAMDNLGAIVGPLLALALVGLVGVRTAIALSVIPGLLAALAIVYAIRHAPRAEQRQRQPLRLRIRPVLTGRLGRLMVGVGAFEFGNVAATLLILRASELLAPGRGQDRATQLALGLYVAYNVAATVASIPAGRLGDRRGAVLALVVGVGLFGLAYAGFAAGGSGVLALAPWFVAAGVAIGCVETAEHAAVAALAPVELRGSAFGLLAAVQSFGNLAASAIAGLLWTLVSPQVAFAYLVAWMLLALAGLLPAARGRAATPSGSLPVTTTDGRLTVLDRREEILKTLRATPVVLQALVKGVDEALLRRRPGPGEWAIIEVVGHLADTEERALARVRRMLAEQDPELAPFDQEALAEERRYLELDLEGELARLEQLRAEHLAVLDGLDRAGWERTGRHGEHGELTVELYETHLAAEEVDHLAQIARLR